jgi:hypothetical protein
MKMPPHPETQRIPENRTGTRTSRGYLLHMIKGNYPSGNVERAMAHATQRQQRKAQNAVVAGHAWKTAPGRVQRALIRANWQDYCGSPAGQYGY